ncbi:MAG: hypothetical protein QM657_18315 [Lacrimispora sp.]|uniref:DUF6906 family protein n=1 Tax=Lacrimispora sp. TaxID=2719234 RepID=UPI0039E36A35
MGKSKAKSPTRQQKVIITGAGLKPESWLVISESPEELKLVSRGSGRSRAIKKDPVAVTTKVSR